MLYNFSWNNLMWHCDSLFCYARNNAQIDQFCLGQSCLLQPRTMHVPFGERHELSTFSSTDKTFLTLSWRITNSAFWPNVSIYKMPSKVVQILRLRVIKKLHFRTFFSVRVSIMNGFLPFFHFYSSGELWLHEQRTYDFLHIFKFFGHLKSHSFFWYDCFLQERGFQSTSKL